MENLQQQAAYSHWATSQWIEFIYSDPAHDAYLFQLISHIVKGERAWLERITQPDWNRDLWQTETKESLLQLHEANRRIQTTIQQIDLQSRIEIVRLNGQSYEPRISDILQHVFFHGENHRGQLASFSAKASLQYPKIDYMTFCIHRLQ
jgi:uncharacterized damage-inducible protein DinB